MEAKQALKEGFCCGEKALLLNGMMGGIKRHPFGMMFDKKFGDIVESIVSRLLLVPE